MKDSRSTVEAWLNERNHDQFKSIAKEVALLERCGNMLRLPYSKSLGKGLFELRERNYGYRIYYTFHQDDIVLLQAGDKGSQKKDIKLAYRRLAVLNTKGN